MNVSPISQPYRTPSEVLRRFVTVVLKRVFAILLPPPKLTVSEWADQKRILSAETASEPGKYSIRRAPYQAGMMDAILDPRIEEVTLMTCARVGKTTVIENVFGYFVDYDPSSMLMVQPSDRKAENFSKLNLGPMIRDNECLRLKFASRSRRTQ